MEMALYALGFGLIVMLAIERTPPDWLKAAAGALILLTLIGLALQIAGFV